MSNQSRILCGLALIAVCLPARAAFIDDFESYTLSTFPSAKWQDFRTLIPGATTPNPSGRIVSTTGPTGATSKVFRTQRAVGTSQGIYARFAPTRFVSISADVRYEFWDNSTNRNGGGWPMAVGFFNATPGFDPNFAPQTMLFADSTNRTWAIYTQTGQAFSTAQFFSLNSTPVLNTWYRLSLSLDTLTGQVNAQVRLSATSALVTSAAFVIPNWEVAAAAYNVGGALDGEYGTNATLGGQASVDNINLVPVPSSAAALAMLGLLCSRRRRGLVR